MIFFHHGERGNVSPFRRGISVVPMLCDGGKGTRRTRRRTLSLPHFSLSEVSFFFGTAHCTLCCSFGLFKFFTYTPTKISCCSFKAWYRFHSCLEVLWPLSKSRRINRASLAFRRGGCHEPNNITTLQQRLTPNIPTTPTSNLSSQEWPHQTLVADSMPLPRAALWMGR